MIGFFLALLPAGCTSEPEQQQTGADTPSDTDTVRVDTSRRPASAADTGAVHTRQDTLIIEGEEEPVTLRRYESAADFPLSFSTYYPEGMRAQRVRRGVGETVRFMKTMPGTPDPASVELHLYPAGTTVDEGRRLVRTKAHGFGEVQEAHEYSWSEAGYSFQGSQYMGHVALGEREGIVFYIMTSMPPEAGDGFSPRADVILEEWEWASGESLSGSGA